MTVVLEILICLLAVFGLYALILRVLAFFTRGRSLRAGVLLSDEEMASDALRALCISDAAIFCERRRGAIGGPVLLLDRNPTPEEWGRLLACGLPVYVRRGAEIRENKPN